MTDTPEQPEAPPESPVGDAPEGLSAILAELKKTEAALMEKLEGTVAQAPPPVSPPESEPAPPDKAALSQREYIKQLEQYAADQAQRAERLALAQEFGIDAGLLTGEFASPESMRAQAQLIALQQDIGELRTELERQRVAAEEVEEEPPEEPTMSPGFEGGVTSLKSPEERTLAEMYDEARRHGRTAQGRRLLLQTIYRDSSKIMPRE